MLLISLMIRICSMNRPSVRPAARGACRLPQTDPGTAPPQTTSTGVSSEPSASDVADWEHIRKPYFCDLHRNGSISLPTQE
jgi:hypothetical protein